MFFLCCLFGFARCPQFELWTPLAGDIAQDGQAVRQSATTLDRWPQHGLHEPSTGWCHPDLKEMPYVSVCLWLLSWCWKRLQDPPKMTGHFQIAWGNRRDSPKNGKHMDTHSSRQDGNDRIVPSLIRTSGKNRYKTGGFPVKLQDDEVWKPSKKKSPQYDAGCWRFFYKE